MVLGCVDDLGHDSTSHVGTDLVGRGDVPRLRKRALFAQPFGPTHSRNTFFLLQ